MSSSGDGGGEVSGAAPFGDERHPSVFLIRNTRRSARGSADDGRG
jgi:hypothetical protein